MAAKAQPNPNSLTLATVDPSGTPSARVVLLKDLNESGYCVFYSHYRSRKGKELGADSRAAAVMHFDHAGRQIRVEGFAVPSPAAESDAYFATRPFMSQLNARVSNQSATLKDPDQLMSAAQAEARAWGVELADADGALSPGGAPPLLPRPAGWGGFRLWFAAVELWLSREGRFHHRLRYERELTEDDAGFTAGVWRAAWLQP